MLSILYIIHTIIYYHISFYNIIGEIMKIYNTASKNKETFKTINNKKLIKMYVCGPTVYDHAHLGHGRTYVAFDIIRRYLEHKNYIVQLIINFTDIDDKIINRANEQGTTIKELSDKFINSFLEDMEKLNVKPALIYPRVSEHINEIIEFIKVLEKKGYAYATADGVYFDTSKYEKYGELRKINIKEETSEQKNININKKNQRDFALWKFAKPDEPKWDSPWGEGRPAWHIECSAMSLKYLGDNFDIHGGGCDLIFPHHENEKAQSECYTDKKWVNYWIHTGFVMVNNEKMSKSLGNFSTLKDLFEKYSAELIRFFLLERHYSSPLDYTEDAINHSKNNLDKLYNTIQNITVAFRNSEIKYKLNEIDKNTIETIHNCTEKFYTAMDDNFNTAQALKYVFEVSTAINKYINNYANSDELPNYSIILKSYEFFKMVGEIFGIFGSSTINTATNTNIAEENLINILMELRADLKKEKNYNLSDKIRDKLKEMDIILEDSPKGTIWKKA